MQKCTRMCGDTPLKCLVKGTMRCAYSFLIGLLCMACSRENEVYQDPCADPNVRVGQHETEQIEPADKHDGRFSVHRYEFSGKGPAHKMAEVKKYELDHMGSRGSEISVKVHVEWPEEGAGLSKDALAKVRKTILWMAFAHTPEVKPYSVPESLGETEESLRKHDKELWAKDGDNREIDDEFGLQPADWAKLVGDALSHKTGRIPAKDDGRVTTKALELGMSGIKKRAQSCYQCKPPENVNGHWWHYCSQWSFIVDLHIDWPFGVTPKENAEWYEWPVITVWNEGYDRDGGNGCHDCYCSKVFSLPDGQELGVEDYFAPDKLKALSAFVTKRFYSEHLEEEDVAEKFQYPLDLTCDEVSMLVTKEGVKWTWNSYSVLSGCDGSPSVFIKWQELKEFRNDNFHKKTVAHASTSIESPKRKDAENGF